MMINVEKTEKIKTNSSTTSEEAILSLKSDLLAFISSKKRFLEELEKTDNVIKRELLPTVQWLNDAEKFLTQKYKNKLDKNPFLYTRLIL